MFSICDHTSFACPSIFKGIICDIICDFGLKLRLCAAVRKRMNVCPSSPNRLRLCLVIIKNFRYYWLPMSVTPVMPFVPPLDLSNFAFLLKSRIHGVLGSWLFNKSRNHLCCWWRKLWSVLL